MSSISGLDLVKNGWTCKARASFNEGRQTKKGYWSSVSYTVPSHSNANAGEGSGVMAAVAYSGYRTKHARDALTQLSVWLRYTAVKEQNSS